MESKSEDAETPRTLFSSMLQHVKPVETIRRPAGRPVHNTDSRHRRSNRISMNTSQAKIKRKSTGSAISDKSPEFLPTPKGLIDDVLKQQSIKKTVHVALRQTHPTILVDVNETESPAPVAAVVDQEDRADVEKFKKTPIPTIQKADDSSKWSSLDGEDEILFHHKPREKRMRLSDINLSKVAANAESTSFSQDLMSKVQALINKNKEAEAASPKDVSKSVSNKKQNIYSTPLLSSTRITSFFEPARKDATTDTYFLNESIIPTNHVKSEKEEEKFPSHFSSHTTVIENPNEGTPDDHILPDKEIVTSTIENSDNEIEGPLELSRIFNETDTSQVPSPHSNGSAFKNQRFPNDHAPNDIITDEKPVDTSSTSNLRRRQSVHHQTVPVVIENEQNADTSKEASVGVTSHKLISREKKNAKKRKLLNKLPFPRSQLAGIVQHYSTLKISKEAFEEIEDVSRQYFENTMNDLEEICHRKNKKIISSEDVVRLMKRRQHLTKKKTLNALIEENLSLEYREELIQVAYAGNNILP
ncbi:uncharacterized protein LOC144427174 [Styela clava]